MSHFANDVHHRVSTRISEIIPNFVESEYPTFVQFLKAYYEFLEQHDRLPAKSTYAEQPGVVSVLAGNSTIVGANTQFVLGGYNNSTYLTTEGEFILELQDDWTSTGRLLDESSYTKNYANDIQLRVGSDEFRIRSITSNTELVIYEVPIRSYFANTHFIETNNSIRQASGAARQIATIHDIDHTLDDFVSYFRDTYLRDIPQGLTDTKTLLPRILDFYQSKGSEQSYQFLFRALYDKDVMFSYPRDSVFTTSDNEYVRPTILRIGYANSASMTGNVSLLETREITGLTSNAHATVSRSVIAYEGDARVVRAFITEPQIRRELGAVLLEDGSQFVLTKYGVPPEGLASVVYPYTLIQELVTAKTFQAGETVSTVPTNDPSAITGTLLGSIAGFTIEVRGSGYQINDLVYPPSRYANGAIHTGGFGAVGKITAFTDVDLTEINVDDAGLGYYAGLTLLVDNTGTGGGTGLAGYVTNVSPGNITLHADSGVGITDGDVLTFVYETDGADYTSSREKLDYYQVGVALADLFGGLVLDDASDSTSDGDDLLNEEDGRQLLQESAIVLTDTSWNTNVGSAIYNANLSTTIIGLTSNLSTFPVYVHGVRTEVGEIYHLTVESFGAGYVAGLPTVSVQTPVQPTSDSAGLDALSYVEIFGEAFDTAAVSVAKETGQIGQVEVLTGGSGYSNVAFTVNSTTSTTTTGNNGELGMSLGALSYGIPYFKNTRSFASADQHFQDVTKYQPFSYVLTVEESLSRYSDILRRLVHPAGGLLLPRQTITVDLDLVSSIVMGGMNLNIDTTTTRISITAPQHKILLAIPVSTSSVAVTAPTATRAATIGLSTTATVITVSNQEETLHVIFVNETNSITVTSGAAVRFAVVTLPVSTSSVAVTAPTATRAATIGLSATATVIAVSNQEETEHLVIPVVTNSITVTSGAAVRFAAVLLSATASVIRVSNEEETTGLQIPVAVANITVTAPTATITTTITLATTLDTYLTAYGNVVITPYDLTLLSLFANWETNRMTVSAPTAVRII